MTTGHRKKRRKEYMHCSNDCEQFDVPKTTGTFYRREKKAIQATPQGHLSPSWAATLPGPSNASDTGGTPAYAATADTLTDCTDPAIGAANDPFGDDDVEAPHISDYEANNANKNNYAAGSAADDGDGPVLDNFDESLQEAAFAAFNSAKLPNLGTSKAGEVAMTMSFGVAHGLTCMALGDLCVL
ncbi:hypothetical protein V5799_011900 [Amblyomma americanum]|uniref:Uncharacterized protein n=1 Tax=Amblyomma americanum TaxID=6943 RepID=A0AAQ4EFS8_AMBAM